MAVSKEWLKVGLRVGLRVGLIYGLFYTAAWLDYQRELMLAELPVAVTGK